MSGRQGTTTSGSAISKRYLDDVNISCLNQRSSHFHRISIAHAGIISANADDDLAADSIEKVQPGITRTFSRIFLFCGHAPALAGPRTAPVYAIGSANGCRRARNVRTRLRSTITQPKRLGASQSQKNRPHTTPTK